ncbi:MAG: type II secretion system F family protein [Candidatus Omnitrophota bacterium]
MSMLIGVLVFLAALLAMWGVILITGAREYEHKRVVSDRLKQLDIQKFASAFTIQRKNQGQFLTRFLRSSGVSIDYKRLLLFSLAGGFFLFMLSGALSHNAAFSFLLGILGAGFPFLYISQLKARRINVFLKQFPDAVALMANCLRAGHGLTAAIDAVAKEMPKPVSEEFGQVLAEMNLGSSAREAFIHMEERIKNRDLSFFSAAVLMQKEVGGSLAEVFNNLEETIRERFELKGELKSLTSQQRLTGMILGLLPIGLGFVVYLLNPSYLSVLFKDPWGQYMLIAAVILQVMGFLLVKKIASVDID